MQSGTILHLALLKKLSSRSPQSKYSQRFARFRIKEPVHPHPYHSAQLFQKYPSSESRQILVSTSKKTTHSLKAPRKKSTGCPQLNLKEQNLNVCGWSIENQQDFDYLLRPVPNYKKTENIFQPKVNYQNKPKFTFCEDESQFCRRHKQKPVQNHINKIELKTVYINPSLTEPENNNEKENRFKDSIESPFPSFRNRLRRKEGKEPRNSKKPLHKLAIIAFRERF